MYIYIFFFLRVISFRILCKAKLKPTSLRFRNLYHQIFDHVDEALKSLGKYNKIEIIMIQRVEFNTGEEENNETNQR